MKPDAKKKEVAPPVEAELPELPPEPEEAPPAEAPEAEGKPDGAIKMSFQKLDQGTAGYRPPDLGPFTCGNCHYFEEDGSCTLVDGEIHADGTCNLFTPNTPEGKEEAPLPPPEAIPAAPAGPSAPPLPGAAAGAPPGLPPELLQ